MPTVVDSFVVELELDPKKFDSGRRQAEDNFDKTKQKAVSSARQVEEAMQKTGESVGMVKTQVLGLFAAFTGLGVAAFATQMVHADAATGRAAKTLDMATKELGAWEGAAALAGAKAGDLTGSFAGLTNALKTAELTGDASLGAKFRQLFDIDVAGPNGLKTAAELYLEIAKKAEGMDPAKAATSMSILGVSPGVIPLLLQGHDALTKNLDAMRQIGAATEGDAAAAIRLENAWTRAFRGVQDAARNFYPEITELGNVIAIAFSPKALDVFAQRWKAVKAFFTQPERVYRQEQDKYLKMDKDFQDWQKGNGAKKFLGETEQGLRNQVGQGAGIPAGGAFKDQAEKEAYIRAEAKRMGIDEDQAMRVAKSEGFYNFYGDKDATGSPTSFGAFQLHRPGVGRNTADGLGTLFRQKTGLDPSDPANERASISFALQHAATSGNGWRDWHGWRGSQFQGLPGPGSGAAGGGGQTTTVNIGKIDVNTQATDAKGIAADLGGAIKRDMTVQQSNSGPQ